MDYTEQDLQLFFGQRPGAWPVFNEFYPRLTGRYPETRVKIQKTQISFYNRHLYACVSFARVKQKAELPENYFVLTLGLSDPLKSDRVAVECEPYPGRWTTHFVISTAEELDEELFGWIEQAYRFAEDK